MYGCVLPKWVRDRASGAVAPSNACCSVVHLVWTLVQPKSQLRLHLVSILKGAEEGFTLWQGMLCSSWVAMCRGTTMRSWLHPLGLQPWLAWNLETPCCRGHLKPWVAPRLRSQAPSPAASFTCQDSAHLDTLCISRGKLGAGAAGKQPGLETPEVSVDVWDPQGQCYEKVKV